jgi:PPK2 family polyphosphate:nucleotide phosphotransferase
VIVNEMIHDGTTRDPEADVDGRGSVDSHRRTDVRIRLPRSNARSAGHQFTMNIDRYRVRPGDRNALSRHRPGDTIPLQSKGAAQEQLQRSILHLEERLELLNAQNEHALLLIFQGMDASGKDGAIKHVMSGVNPLFTEVHMFKQPSSEEMDHDFLWRGVKALPGRGTIGIFDRSYYEDVIVVRVHPEILADQQLPPDRIGPRIWQERFEDIRALERHLWRNGTTRLLERFDSPGKNWKFSARDVRERENWAKYTTAYREALAATTTIEAPWYIVPADHKWFARWLVAEVINDTLDRLNLKAPVLSPAEKRHLSSVRRQLAGPQARPQRPTAAPVKARR